MAERLDISDFNIEKLAQQNVVLDSHEETPTINTVFNINPKGILPPRFLVGFLPAFQIAQKIAEITDGKIVPKVRVFEPTNFTTYVNQIDPDKATAQINIGNNSIIAMAKKHFPHIHLTIAVDQPVSLEGLRVLAEVNELIPGEHDHILESLLKTGKQYGGLTGQSLATLYPAHHPFGWLNLQHPSIFTDVPNGPVINTLPPSERRFTTIRHATTEAVRNSKLAELLIPRKTAEFELAINGAHYIPVKNEIGTFIEPSLERVLEQSCRSTSQELARLVLEHKGGIRSNLKKAAIDFHLLIATLAKTQSPEDEQTSLRTVIGL